MAKERKSVQYIREVSWEEYDRLLSKLALKIRNNALKSTNNSIGKYSRFLYGIPRGGLIVATCLTHLDECLSLFVSDVSRVADPNFPLVIVDDIVDSGKTAEEYKNIIQIKVEVAALFYREGASFEPDFYAEKLDSDVWIKFPWERSV